MKQIFPLLAIAVTTSLAADSWVVGSTRPYPYNTLQNAINSITNLSDNLYIFVEEPDLVFNQPLSIFPTPNWNGYFVRIRGGKNIPHRVAYFGDEVHELSPDGMEFSYVNMEGPHGLEGRMEGSTRFYYLKDHLGSTRAVFRDDGSLVESHMYYSYGKQTGPLLATTPDATTREKYTGKEFDTDGADVDESGINLNYFGARYYDPDIGLWISPDPVRQFASAYANSGNPINSIDPDGMAEYTILDENGTILMNWKDGNFSDRRSMVFQNGKLIETGQIAPHGQGWTGAEVGPGEKSWSLIGLRFNFHYDLLLDSYERRFMEAGHIEGMQEFRGGGSFDFKYPRTSLEADLGKRRSLDAGMAYGYLMNSRDAGNTYFGNVVTDKYGSAGYWTIAKPLAGANELIDREFKSWGRQIEKGHMGEDPRTGRMNDFGSSLSR